MRKDMYRNVYPPKVYNARINKSDDKAFLLDRLRLTLHLSKGEYNLLAYYGTRSNGFSPAAKLICDTLGLSRRALFKIRGMLESDGLISVSERSIVVDWHAIRIFASLDEHMTAKHCSKKVHYTIYNTVHDFDDTEKMSIKELVDRLAKMSDK